MTTKRETILQAIVTRLNAVSGVPGGVHRSREDAMTRDEAPSIAVRPDGEEVAENAIGMMDARLAVRIDVYTRGAVPDQLADPIVEDVHAALMAEPTLGGLAVDIIEEGTDFDAEGADQDAGFTSMRFIVWHRRRRASLVA